MEENKIIRQNGKIYKEYDYITEDIRVKNLEWRWIDFIYKSGDDKGYINWEKVNALKPLWIIMLTHYGSGKTFGVSRFILEKLGENLGFINNTSSGADNGVEALLGSFKKDNEVYFDGWEKIGNSVVDGEKNKRIKIAGMKNKGAIKMSRDFDAKYILYDEFNQEYQYAQERGAKPTATIGTIKGRFSDEEHDKPLNHIFMFGNKDGKKNFLALSIMEELGIYGFQQFTEIFIVERRSEETKAINPDFWLQQSVCFNPRYSKEEQQLKISNWMDHPERYKSSLDSLVNGDAKVGIFNDDSESWVFDNIYLQLEQEHPNVIDENQTWYLYFKPDRWFEIKHLPWGQNGQEFQRRKTYIKSFNGNPKSRRKYAWGVPQQDGVISLRDVANEEIKNNILRQIGNNEIIYDKIATKVNFLEDFKK